MLLYYVAGSCVAMWTQWPTQDHSRVNPIKTFGHKCLCTNHLGLSRRALSPNYRPSKGLERLTHLIIPDGFTGSLDSGTDAVSHSHHISPGNPRQYRTGIQRLFVAVAFAQPSNFVTEALFEEHLESLLRSMAVTPAAATRALHASRVAEPLRKVSGER